MAIRVKAVVASLLALGASAASAAAADGAVDAPSRWFVELAGPPIVEGGSAAALRGEKASFRAAARAARVAFQERRAFDTLWNGLSVDATPSQLAALRRLPGVVATYPVETVALPPVEQLPELGTALAMTGADVAQSELGYTGSGVRVAVMDTGVDYDHADLGGDGTARSNSPSFPSGRVVAGFDFVGDAFNADPTSPEFNPVASPDPFPDDCNGHGTHVAGIVGASGAVTGVAPGVTFGAYRVFGCEGSTTADIMLAAMERALADGMHVLNMSIGSAFQWPQYPTAAAADRLVRRGVVVVASIGNSGANGLYSASAPGVGEKVIGVASYDNSHVELSTFTISPDDAIVGYGPATAAPPPPTGESAELARTGTTASAADACAALPAGSLAGKIALVRRGTCTFHQKSLNAQSAGAIGVVLYNNSAGRFSPTVAGTPAITIPVVAVSDAEGALIDGRLAAGPVTLTWRAETGLFLNPTGGLISSFSSFGMAPDLSLKPDLAAPGGLIRSTYPLEEGGYATISGTSMASPHVAGAVALLLQARPRTSAAGVRVALQNTADPKPWFGNPALGFLDNVHRQGAGMLDVDDAILATSRVEPSKLALGESEAGPRTVTLTIENRGGAAVTYALSHAPALSTGPNTFTPGFTTGFAAVAFSAPAVTVAAGGAATVDVTITANAALPDRSLYGGYVVLTPDDGGPALRVPYAGLKGDYQSIVAMPSAPQLGQLVEGTFTARPSGAAFTMVGDDLPLVRFHLDHGVQLVRFEAFDAATGRAWHRVFEERHLGRSSTATATFTLSWDGVTVAGKKVITLPDGTYVIRLSVLKALGDAENPAHWETWTSPPVTIDRP